MNLLHERMMRAARKGACFEDFCTFSHKKASHCGEALTGTIVSVNGGPAGTRTQDLKLKRLPL